MRNHDLESVPSNTWWTIAPLCLAIFAFVCSCDTHVREKTLRVSPDEVAPGSSVVLHASDGLFVDIDDVDVRFDGRPAAVIRIVDSSAVEVLVPRLRQGAAEITLRYAKRPYAKAVVTIVPPPLQRVFLTIAHGDIELQRVQPYNGRYDAPAAGGRRLSYDVLDGGGRLLHTSAIPYPEVKRVEVFTEPNRREPKRLDLPGPVSFIIKIPYVDYRTGEITRIQFFDVGPGVDLNDAKGRGARKPLTVVEIP
jgi:hypothetical protein